MPVLVTHEAVKRWADSQKPKEDGKEDPRENKSAEEGCLDVWQEDVLPEEQRIMDSPERIPERYVGLEPGVNSSDEAVESEASFPGLQGESNTKVRPRSLSDDPADGDDEGQPPKKKMKASQP